MIQVVERPHVTCSADAGNGHHRIARPIVGDAQRTLERRSDEELIAPLWSRRKNETLELITRTLAARDSWQGKNYRAGQE